MIREAPRIETDRLVLRPWRRDDFRPYHAILQQPAVHRHFGPNFWPSEVPELGPTLIELYRQLEKTGGILLQAAAEYIDEPSRQFVEMTTDSDTIVRVLWYPPISANVP